MKLEINVTKNRSGQSDRHSQICDCQNSINDKFVPDANIQACVEQYEL